MRRATRETVRTPAQEFLAEARLADRRAAPRDRAFHPVGREDGPAAPGRRRFLPAAGGSFSNTEFSGRAGGLMGIRWSERSGFEQGRCVLRAARSQGLEARRRTRRFRSNCGAGGGSSSSAVPMNWKGNSAAASRRFTGGARAEEGLHAMGEYRPLAPFRPFEQLVRGWLTTGEMIAACIRKGRMPTI